jgi:hypothetical protein
MNERKDPRCKGGTWGTRLGRWDGDVGDKTEQQSVVYSHRLSRCLGACNDDLL